MTNKRPVRKDEVEYGYYSRLLQKPFDSIEELKEAEAIERAKLEAKELKAATKKTDAKKVEDAFKAMNQARREYKENILKLTAMYQEELKKLKTSFEADKNGLHSAMAEAEKCYEVALKEFTDKYPEGYHLTLKDGDFESTVSTYTNSTRAAEDVAKVTDLLTWLFRTC